MYYIASVGMSFSHVLGKQGDVSNFIFGLLVIVCSVQTYYHAARTKQIDVHKKWAYRLASLFFGILFGRLYFLVVFIAIGTEDIEDEKHMKTIQAAAFVLDLIFYIPFLILADMIWSREQQLKRYHDSFDQQPTKRQDVPPSTSRPESASLVQPVPWSVPVDTPIGSSMTQ